MMCVYFTVEKIMAQLLLLKPIEASNWLCTSIEICNVPSTYESTSLDAYD